MFSARIIYSGAALICIGLVLASIAAAARAEVDAHEFAVSEFPPVFSVIQKAYLEKPISHVTITNIEDDDLTKRELTPAVDDSHGILVEIAPVGCCRGFPGDEVRE